MVAARLWRAKPKRVEKVHTWRSRRSRFGELVQWDTSEHDWLEGRGPKLYLISMIDDATSRMLARFVEHDSSEENMRLLQTYLQGNGRPLSFYTDKASLFANLPKSRRGELAGKDHPELPPTQIGRALRELDIEWIAAHSPQAKGRIECGFGTAQDRLVKGLRVAGAKTLEQANAYLESEFLPWWNQTLTVRPATSDDAHRVLGKQHNLAASLSHVESRQSSQRLHHPLGQPDVSNSTGRYPGQLARPHCPCRTSSGWFASSALPPSLSHRRRMSASSQSSPFAGTQTTRPQNRGPQERLDEGFSSRQERHQPQNLHTVGWAKSAQPSSRLLYPKTAAQKLHQNRVISKTKTPRTGNLGLGLTGG